MTNRYHNSFLSAWMFELKYYWFPIFIFLSYVFSLSVKRSPPVFCGILIKGFLVYFQALREKQLLHRSYFLFIATIANMNILDVISNQGINYKFYYFFCFPLVYSAYFKYAKRLEHFCSLTKLGPIMSNIQISRSYKCIENCEFKIFFKSLFNQIQIMWRKFCCLLFTVLLRWMILRLVLLWAFLLNFRVVSCVLQDDITSCVLQDDIFLSFQAQKTCFIVCNKLVEQWGKLNWINIYVHCYFIKVII